ncbi:MAG: phosphoenolpyruvate--protein phosphotransferase [Pseudobdellovibrionaceae bacterium]|nr:phosphoenolpyruvate--protein phosphotransferase [Bdellovibrionales bacterium]USN47637.1 MAG: phosphoenolpyruvate--protein phosphotransferase [Pseudobdellovibrionaceae bacterium]
MTIDSFFGKTVETSNPTVKLPDGVITAPLSGVLIPLSEIPDPVFSKGLLGDGVGIDPTDGKVFSPVHGQVSMIHRALHAITLDTIEGAQILIHIGIDTVALKGQGIDLFIKRGEWVQQGQLLAQFDLDFLAVSASSLVTPIIVLDSKPGDLTLSESLSSEVVAGSPLLSFSQGLQSAGDLAQPPKTEVFSRWLVVNDPTGLHARPAAMIAASAKNFESDIRLCRDSDAANAKSVMAIMGLEVSGNDRIRFSAAGPDAEIAIDAMEVDFNFLTTPETSSDVQAFTPPASKNVVPPVERKKLKGAVTLKGVSASPGVAVGQVVVVKPEDLSIPTAFEGSEQELNKLSRALEQAKADLQTLAENIRKEASSSQAAIFSAHEELMFDPDLLALSYDGINAGKNAAVSWNHAINTHATRLSKLSNELLASRANDLRDVGERVLRHLLGVEKKALARFPNTVLVAENLTPSETASLDRQQIRGFCTLSGGTTSHVAILARSLGIPAIAGIDPMALLIPDGSEAILDGEHGLLQLNPSKKEIRHTESRQQKILERRKTELEHALKPAVTTDGHRIEVMANIGGISDAKESLPLGGEGVGLLRSEFLFLERDIAPGEAEQQKIYQTIIDELGESRPLTVRTLDVGGDKPLAYLPLPKEENPFLGIRGIRLSLKHQDIFRSQLRALLKTKSKNPLRIMFPMISGWEELQKAKSILQEEIAQVGDVQKVSVGIMIEVPSSAIMAESLAQEVDFFSIGTNDLTQYVLAMDRGHAELAKDVDGLHPAVLRLIEQTVNGAHAHSKWVGVCGGIASDPVAAPILIGLGVDELSVSVPSLPAVKASVRQWSLSTCKELARKALQLKSSHEVRALVLEYLATIEGVES